MRDFSSSNFAFSFLLEIMKNPFKKYADFFSENNLLKKIKNYFKEAGTKVVYQRPPALLCVHQKGNAYLGKKHDPRGAGLFHYPYRCTA